MRFRSLIENASDLILTLNPDYTIAYVSPSVVRILGYTVAAITGAKITDFIDPQDVPNFVAATEHRARTPGPSPFSMQVHVRHADGSWRTLEGMGNNLMDQPGVSGLVINARDITERKRAEEQKRESEERFSKVFYASPVAISITTLADARFVEVNDSFLKLVGQPSREEIIGRSVLELGAGVSPEYRASLAQTLRAHGRVSNFEGQFDTLTGEKRDVLASLELIELNGQGCILTLAQDITERKRAEDAVRESEDRYHDLVESSQDLFCTHDLDGKLLSVNDAAVRLTGYPRAALLQMNMADLLVPDVRRGFSAYLKKIRANGQASGLMQIQTAGGESRVWEYDNTMRTEGVADPIVRGMARDVTERKRAEEAVQQSEARHRALVEQASDGIFIADAQGHYLDVNTSGCAMLGYTREEILGMDYTYILLPEDLAQDPPKLDALIAGKTVLRERLYKRKDGTAFPVEISAKMLSDGRIQNIVRDITERKRAEEALHAAKNLLDKTFASLDESVLIVDPNTRMIITCNPAVGRIFGYAEKDVIGRTTEFMHVDRSSFDRFGQELFPALDAAGVFHTEFQMRRKDGSVFPTENTVTEIKDDLGRRASVVSVVRDITERKRAEEEIERLAKFPSENPNPVLRLSRDGIVMYANAASGALLSMWGCAVGGSAPQSWRDLTAQALVSRENKTVEVELDGKVYSMFVTPVAEPDYVNLYGRDITERKRAEAEIKKQLAELERWQQATMGRETRVLDLKREVNELLGQDSKPPRYASAE